MCSGRKLNETLTVCNFCKIKLIQFWSTFRLLNRFIVLIVVDLGLASGASVYCTVVHLGNIFGEAIVFLVDFNY